MNCVTKKAATWAFVKALKFAAPLAPPYNFGKFAASHCPSVRLAEVLPNCLMRFWPKMPCQKAVLPVLNCDGTGVDATVVRLAVALLLAAIGSLVLLLTEAPLLITVLTA